MKSLRFALRSFGREIRSGEVLVLLAAVALAVAALLVFAWLGADWATRFQYIVMAALAATAAVGFVRGREFGCPAGNGLTHALVLGCLLMAAQLLLLGFGIAEPAHAARVAACADGGRAGCPIIEALAGPAEHPGAAPRPVNPAG